MLNNSTTEDENPKAAECAKLLEASLAIVLSSTKIELLEDENKPSSN